MPGGESIHGKDETSVTRLVSLFSLEGRVAVVLGAGGELGQVISQALASAGADIFAIGPSTSTLDQTCTGVRVTGKRAWSYVADVAEPEGIERAMSRAQAKGGRIDIFVNAAGVQLRKLALDVTPNDWDRMVNVNLKGVFFACQAAARYMEGGGSIINLTSLTSVIGITSLSVYGACKGGVTQMVKALATEWAPAGIRVNAIGPGRIRTPMTETLFEDEVMRDSFFNLIPLGRAGRPMDLAGAAIFLASDASAYMTGQTLYVDGGWLAAGGNPRG